MVTDYLTDSVCRTHSDLIWIIMDLLGEAETDWIEPVTSIKSINRVRRSLRRSRPAGGWPRWRCTWMAHAARSLDDSIKSRELIERRVCVCVCVCVTCFQWVALNVINQMANQLSGQCVTKSHRPERDPPHDIDSGHDAHKYRNYAIQFDVIQFNRTYLCQ